MNKVQIPEFEKSVKHGDIFFGTVGAREQFVHLAARNALTAVDIESKGEIPYKLFIEDQVANQPMHPEFKKFAGPALATVPEPPKAAEVSGIAPAHDNAAFLEDARRRTQEAGPTDSNSYLFEHERELASGGTAITAVTDLTARNPVTAAENDKYLNAISGNYQDAA